MLRRTVLRALTALPVVSVPEPLAQSRDTSSTTTYPVEQENDLWFWYYIHSANERARVMSTERSRERAVSEMDLTALSTDEAREMLRRANDGEYGIDDMPDRWQRVLTSIEQVEFV